MNLADGDWVWIESPHVRVKAEIKLMEGVNPDTVWTWNAIGKRAGAWNLSATAPESTKGFLLNHVISELLPPQPDGHRYANIDPVTGQAAWYDLKVRLVKCTADEAGETAPHFATLTPPLPPAPDELAYGDMFRADADRKARGRT
jgi:anaerobic selenocysteine-containing dehydrogenase